MADTRSTRKESIHLNQRNIHETTRQKPITGPTGNPADEVLGIDFGTLLSSQETHAHPPDGDRRPAGA